ncbi:MAG: DUF1064 domain-containing protein [Prevotella sp.]|nr:DUF1064 domain-containing protein [Prevotella sp.]
MGKGRLSAEQFRMKYGDPSRERDCAYNMGRKRSGGRNKYHACKTADGYDSRREGRRGRTLELMERAGEIFDLRRQVRYELVPTLKDGDGRTVRGVSYIADFVYKDKDGNVIVEDVKGVKTPLYIVKRKLMLYRYGITIRET